MYSRVILFKARVLSSTLLYVPIPDKLTFMSENFGIIGGLRPIKKILDEA